MSIGKLDRILEKLLKCGKLNDDAGVKLCFKVLKILVKKHHLLIWFPLKSGEIIFDELHIGKEYYATFKTESGADFLITLVLSKFSDCVRYEFEIGLRGSHYLNLELYHILHRFESGKRTSTGVVAIGKDLPVKYGRLIVEIYNKVANQLLPVVGLNKVREVLVETLEKLKIIS